MELAAILELIAAGKSLVAFALRQAALAQQAGEFTPEQLDEIKAKAAISDDAWDAAVEAAKAANDG